MFRKTHIDGLMFVDPCIIVESIQKNSTRCNSIPKFDFIFI